MSSTINASNGTVSGLISTGDDSGQLQLQVNNGTPAVTLNTSGAIGVGSSPSYGTSGQVLTSSGSGSAPTWSTVEALPSQTGENGKYLTTNGTTASWANSISSNKVNMALATNMSAGDVAMIKSDGTIEKISQTIANQIPYGSASLAPMPSAYNAGSIAFDPFNSGKFVIVYRAAPGGYYGSAIVGQLTGSTITYGSAYVFKSASTGTPVVAFDPNNANKIVIAYSDGNYPYYLKSIIGTISGTTLSFGSEVGMSNVWASDYQISFDKVGGNKFSIAYRWVDNGYGRVVFGTISGTTITQGSTTNYNTSSTTRGCAHFNPNVSNQIIFGYENGSNLAEFVIGTVSGTSVTLGTPVTSTMSGCPYLQFSPNTSGQFIASTASSCLVGSISSGTITVNTPITTNKGKAYYVPSILNRLCFVQRSTQMQATTGVISGTTITLGTTYDYGSSSLTDFNNDSVAFVQNTSTFLTGYQVSSDNYYIPAIIGDSNYSASSIIGVLQESGTAGQSKPVTIKSGIDSTRSGLTVGSVYYVQPDGSVSTVSTSPAQKLGRAITPTSIALQSTLWEV